jgi:hypothetical protein
LSDLTDLECRIKTLEEIEAIKKLKIRYWDSVDGKAWDHLADCLSEDFVFESEQLKRIEGRGLFVGTIRRLLDKAVTSHQGHNPEIEIIAEKQARGRWALNDYIKFPDGRVFSGRGHYAEEYRKEGGVWKIKSSKLSYFAVS